MEIRKLRHITKLVSTIDALHTAARALADFLPANGYSHNPRAVAFGMEVTLRAPNWKQDDCQVPTELGKEYEALYHRFADVSRDIEAFIEKLA